MAEETPTDSARKWVLLYEQGILTGHEFAMKILASAARHDPAEMAHLISEELLDLVRDAARFPATEVSEVLPEYENTCLSPREVQELREDVFDGTWKWFRFFAT